MNRAFGVESLNVETEFRPRKYKSRICDLRKYGVPTVPVVGHTSYRRLDEPSVWHVHKGCVEFLYCVAGVCAYASKGRRYCLRPGMMFVSRENEEHRQLECPKGYANFYLHFRPAANAVSRWFEDEMGKLPRLFACGRTVPLRFNRILSLIDGQRPRAELQIRLQTEVNALLLGILDCATVSVEKRWPEAVEAVAERMRQNPEREYPLAGLVGASGMSKASFMSQFKAAHGYSPHAYHLLCRVEAAKDLLGAGATEKTVAERLGFTTPQNLFRAFKNFTGVSPRQWAAQNMA